MHHIANSTCLLMSGNQPYFQGSAAKVRIGEVSGSSSVQRCPFLLSETQPCGTVEPTHLEANSADFLKLIKKN